MHMLYQLELKSSPTCSIWSRMPNLYESEIQCWLSTQYSPSFSNCNWGTRINANIHLIKCAVLKSYHVITTIIEQELTSWSFLVIFTNISIESMTWVLSFRALLPCWLSFCLNRPVFFHRCLPPFSGRPLRISRHSSSYLSINMNHFF